MGSPYVSFEADDVEFDRPIRPPFDLIHSRYMSGSIRDRPGLIKRCYEHIEDGGWSEIQDLDVCHYSEDKSIEEGNKVVEFMSYITEACDKVGRTADFQYWLVHASVGAVTGAGSVIPR